MSARRDLPSHDSGGLRRAVKAVPGIREAAVEVADGKTTVRAQLDGSRSSAEVLEDVRSAVAQWRAGSVSPGTGASTTRRRSGLGRGLSGLLAETPQPRAVYATPRIDTQPLAAIDVLDTEHSLMVRATDAHGSAAVVVAADERDVDRLVVDAVATLRRIEPPEVLGIADHVVGGHRLATVVTRASDGSVHTASSASSDWLLAVGRAAWITMDG